MKKSNIKKVFKLRNTKNFIIRLKKKTFIFKMKELNNI
jgi:hypothetical protein